MNLCNWAVEQFIHKNAKKVFLFTQTTTKSVTQRLKYTHSFPQTCNYYPISCLLRFGPNNEVLTVAVFFCPELIKCVGGGVRIVTASEGEAKQGVHKRIPDAIPPMPMWSFQQTGGADRGIWALGGDKRADCHLNPGHACYP